MAGGLGGQSLCLVLRTEGVANRYAFTEYARAAEFVIVADVVGVYLWAYKNAVRDVKLEAATHMHEQVIAAYVIGAARKAAIDVWGIEANALSAKACHHFRSGAAAKPRCVNRVEVVEDWAIRLEAVTDVRVSAPSNFGLDAELVLKQDVAAKRRKTTATQFLGRVASAGTGG